MRILQIASLVEPLTERPPGGAELCVQILSNSLARLGHEVTLLALQGSKAPEGVQLLCLDLKPGELLPIAIGEIALNTPQFRTAEHSAAERRVFERVAQYLTTTRFDVVHNHGFDVDALFYLESATRASSPSTRFVHTLHLPPFLPWIRDELAKLPSSVIEQKFVTVSQAMAHTYAQIIGSTPQVIYNGIPLDKLLELPLQELPDDAPYLFAGRISPEKGLHTAIELVVHRLQKPLVIMGRVYDEQYFRQQIEPLLGDPLIDYRGFSTRPQVLEAMFTARALVAPIEWDEPFGFVFVEALACGCPVVSYARGATPEIIEPARTGFLASDQQEFLDALTKVQFLDRALCRASVQSRFTDLAMASAYNALYERLVYHWS